MELLTVDKVEEAREKLAKAAEGLKLKTEAVHVSQSIGRVLAKDVVAMEPVPAFAKSTVDGYAVIAQNTQGVTESIPVFLEVIEEVEIGTAPKKTVAPGQCIYVPTGGMLPEGADAMVMVEFCEAFDEKNIAVYDGVSPGRNVIQAGEDVKKDQCFLKKGTLIRPQEVGVLAATGYEQVEVFSPMHVTIVSTGDELVPVEAAPAPGQIRDINTYAIEAMCKKYGFFVQRKFVLKDEEPLLTKTVAEAMNTSDLVVVSGGSSQGKKDITAKVLDKLARPGVFTHGIALKPGKPTILGYDEDSQTVLMGLPGHPVAAMIVFEFFAVWLLREKTGQAPPKEIVAKITENVAGGNGRASCLMVALTEEVQGSGYTAKPVLGKSGLITTLTGACGYTFIETNKEGIRAEETIRVTLL
ncbi:MAG: molybdopterin molybdotransferase MoeA [Anaerovoracaceae bacterium]